MIPITASDQEIEKSTPLTNKTPTNHHRSHDLEAAMRQAARLARDGRPPRSLAGKDGGTRAYWRRLLRDRLGRRGRPPVLELRTLGQLRELR